MEQHGHFPQVIYWFHDFLNPCNEPKHYLLSFSMDVITKKCNVGHILITPSVHRNWTFRLACKFSEKFSLMQTIFFPHSTTFMTVN